MKSQNRLETISCALLLIFILISALSGICKAQDGNTIVAIALPITVFFVTGFFAFCILTITIISYCKAKKLSTPQIATTQHIFNLQGQPINSPSQTNGSNSQRYPLQNYSSSSSRVLHLSPSTNVSQTVPQASEPASLPEATLHQGDAPPGYEEAIGMETVIIKDLDNA